MQGIELSRRFYFEVVRPWLGSVAPDLTHAAGLFGSGSELLGFDDELSKDHNWGPRVHLIVERESFDANARRLVREFSTAAPTQFLGEPIGWRSRPNPPASGEAAAGTLEHGLEIHTIEATLKDKLGIGFPVALSPLQWLGLSEQKLLAFTSGAVFHDDDQQLTQARTALAYFPDDVWVYKIACQWRRIAEEQSFVGRAGQTGDDLGSRVIASRLVRDIMRLSFLIERRYAPYSKWIGTAFRSLPLADRLLPHLERALLANQWRERGDALASAYMTLAQRQLADGVGDTFEPVIGPYFDRPFTTINADDIITATLKGIQAPSLKELPVIGSLDQVSDLTPVLEDTSAAQRMMHALFS